MNIRPFKQDSSSLESSSSDHVTEAQCATLKQRNRYDVIDLLRGIAILLVVIRHVQLRIHFETADVFSKISDQIFSAIFISGTEGVRIFFVVSGFIITMTSLNRYAELRQINVIEFYKFRFARIGPCLLALLAILTILHFYGVKGYVINSKFSYAEALFSALTFHLNWLEGMKGYLPPSWDVLWSLSVEEVFYIVFPMVLLVARKKWVLYIILVGLIIIGPFYRHSLEGSNVWQTKAYLSCMDSIALGCLFALLSHNKKMTQSLMRVFSMVGCVIVVFVLMVKKDPLFSFINELYLFKTLLSVGVGLLLVASVRQELKPLFQKILSPITLYGRLSYEIYLTHAFVVLSGVKLYRSYEVDINDSFIWLVGIIIVSGLLGYAVERFFSKPMNLWIRGFNKTKI